jgi:hypothetical protein
MDAQLHLTVPSRLSRHNYRTTARIVGALYLAGMVVGIAGNLFIQSILGAPDHLSTIAASAYCWPSARYFGCSPLPVTLLTGS